MRGLPVAILSIAAALVPAAGAWAQFPGRDRGGFSREEPGSRSRERSREAPGPVAANPFSALERELISLKDDIHLKPGQADAWAAFDRDVRALAEIDRAERKRLVDLRAAPKTAPPTALSVIGGLADDARQRSEAAGNVQRDLQALYDRLDEGQRRMLDRRIVQSQTEPLGR